MEKTLKYLPTGNFWGIARTIYIDKKNPNGRKILDYKIKYNIVLLILWMIYFIVRNYLLIIMKIDIVGDFIK